MSNVIYANHDPIWASPTDTMRIYPTFEPPKTETPEEKYLRDRVESELYTRVRGHVISELENFIRAKFGLVCRAAYMQSPIGYRELVVLCVCTSHEPSSMGRIGVIEEKEEEYVTLSCAGGSLFEIYERLAPQLTLLSKK